MLQNKSIKRLYGVLASLLLLAAGACSDKNEPVIIENEPVVQLPGTWTMTTAGYGLSYAATETNTVKFDATNNVTMTYTKTGSDNTPYCTATGTYTLTADNMLKVQWKTMNIDGENDNIFNAIYMMGKMTISGSSMQWDYIIYDNSTSQQLAGPLTARFTRSNN